MGKEDGEEAQAKATQNTFNQLLEENFLNLKKKMPINTRHTEHQIDRTGEEISTNTKSSKR